MRSVLLILWVGAALLGGACGKKAGAADVDRYANQQLAPHLAKALAARAGYRKVKATDAGSPGSAARLRARLDVAVVPLLTQALDGATAVTPPKAAAAVHDRFLATLRQELDAVSAMNAALAPVDPAKFEAAHAQMMEAQVPMVGWERQFEELLRDHGVKLARLPDVDIPKPPPSDEPPAPAAASPCGSAPCPCAPGTEVKQGDTLVGCTLTKEIGQMCGPGAATFHPGGTVKSCVGAYLFAVPETPPDRPKPQLPVCGPGELVRTADGAIERCVIASALVVGTSTIAKGSAVTFGPAATAIAAEALDGTRQCFGPDGAVVAC